MRQRHWRLAMLTGLLAWPAGGWSQMTAARFKPGPTNPFVMGIGGQGRVVPQGGLLRLSAQPGPQGAAIVGQIMVKTSDWVEPGQLLAVLNTQPIFKAQADASLAQVAVAQAELEQAKAAQAQTALELAAQEQNLIDQMKIAELTAYQVNWEAQAGYTAAVKQRDTALAALVAMKAEQPLVTAVGNATVALAQAQYDDVPRLSSGSRKIAAAGLLEARTGMAKADADMANQITQLQAQADAAELNLKHAEWTARIGAFNAELEGRPEDAAAKQAHNAWVAQQDTANAVKAQRAADVAAAQARLAAAQADAAAAQAQVALSEIRAPSKGQILGIHAHPGELVGPLGVFDFGDTRDMFVDVEVAYDDVINARVGQKAVISCDALPSNNTGVVVEVGAMVGNNQLQNINPTAFTDPRVVMVKVHLDKPEVFANLVNGQVTVRLEP